MRDRFDAPLRPRRWPSGAAGLHWPASGAATGIIMAKVSLDDDRWLAEAWFATEPDPIVDDESGEQRPAAPIVVVDTGMRREDRTDEFEPIVALVHATDGVLFVSGTVHEISGSVDIRRLEGTSLHWNDARAAFDVVGSLKITSTRVDGEKTLEAGWSE